MSRNSQSMTPIQKQAVFVCAICALAILITASVTYVLLNTKGGGTGAGEVQQVEEPDDLATHYQVNTQSAALLTETDDAGQTYLDETLFLGDSNTVRLYNNGLITLQQFCAKEGIGIQDAISEELVTFKGTDQRYTMAQAVAMMKPRRVVITLGTNDNGMEVETFIEHYTQLIQDIQSSYPYTDIIVNTIPPVPQDHSNYPSVSQEKIDDLNMALLTMCENLGVKFLNSAEVLKDSATGFGKDDYYISGDIHLKSSGLKAVLNYLTTHAYETEDRRPDTSNIPTRTLEYTSNPSDPVTSSSSEAVEEGETFEAHYRIDHTGGTLTSGDTSGETSLSFNVTADQSVTVTAVPADGYFFVNWSDGVASRTRTDSAFKQNLDVTAVFSSASVEISGEGSGVLGMNYTFKAKLSGKYAKAENLHWYVNGVESKEAAGKTSITFVVDPVLANETYSVYAVVTYNDSQVTSNTLHVSFDKGVSSGSSSSSSSSSSKPESSSSSSSSSEKEEPSEEAAASSSSSSSSSSKTESAGSSSSSSKPESSSSSSSSSKPVASSSSGSSSAINEEPATSKPSTSSSSSTASSSTSREDSDGTLDAVMDGLFRVE